MLKQWPYKLQVRKFAYCFINSVLLQIKQLCRIRKETISGAFNDLNLSEGPNRICCHLLIQITLHHKTSMICCLPSIGAYCMKMFRRKYAAILFINTFEVIKHRSVVLQIKTEWKNWLQQNIIFCFIWR